MIKVFLFDFFDVVREDSFHSWMRAHGYTRDDAPGEVSRRMDTGQINVEQFLDELASIAGQTAQEIRSEFAAYTAINADVVSYIRELRDSYLAALVSNADAHFLRDVIAKNGLDDVFDELFISSEIGFAKPDPEFFAHVLDQLDVEPREVLFIDDQEKNVQAAEQCGIQSVVFTSADDLRSEVRSILTSNS